MKIPRTYVVEVQSFLTQDELMKEFGKLVARRKVQFFSIEPKFLIARKSK